MWIRCLAQVAACKSWGSKNDSSETRWETGSGREVEWSAS